MAQLPFWIRASPVGFHIIDFAAFLATTATAPVTKDPKRANYANPLAVQHMLRAETPDPRLPLSLANGPLDILSISYNTSRDTDRVCPMCRRWYRLGEGFGFWGSYEQFLVRDEKEHRDEVSVALRERQEGTWLCSKMCEVYKHGAAEETFGKDMMDKEGMEVVRVFGGRLYGDSRVRYLVREPHQYEKRRGLSLVYDAYNFK